MAASQARSIAGVCIAVAVGSFLWHACDRVVHSESPLQVPMSDHGSLPVGTVVAFWGSKAEVDQMASYELCDGEPVRTAGSPLAGKTKPDLRDRFVMGYGGVEDLRETAVVGGANETPRIAQGRTEGISLTVDQLARHNHPHFHYVAEQAFRERRYLGEHRNGTITIDGEDTWRGAKYSLQASNHQASYGRTSTDEFSYAGKGMPHDHGLPDIPPQDNRPAFVALYYIIRVK